MKKLLTLTAVGAVMFASTQANAAGFLLREQSVSGMGNAFAGATAGAEDASYSFWNPAGLTRQEGTNFNGNMTFLYSTIEAESQNTGNKDDNLIPFSAIPSMYISHQVDDKITVGFSVSAPFGLVTEYNRAFSNGSPLSQDSLSDLKTVNVAQTVAYKATDKLSLGAGFNIQYIEANLESSLGGGAMVQKLKGQTADIGYTLGALYELSDTTRFGVGYRSEIEHKIKGNGTGPLSNGDITAQLTTPDLLSFGVYHELNCKWALMAEAQRTGWSSFQVLDVKPLNAPVQEKWDDVWFYSVGASYQYNDNLKLKFGLAYDNNPVEDQYRTMRIPDSDRVWYSVGAEYKYDENITLNTGYTFISADSTSVSHGTDTIDYKGNIHLLGFGFNYNF